MSDVFYLLDLIFSVFNLSMFVPTFLPIVLNKRRLCTILIIASDTIHRYLTDIQYRHTLPLSQVGADPAFWQLFMNSPLL